MRAMVRRRCREKGGGEDGFEIEGEEKMRLGNRQSAATD